MKKFIRNIGKQTTEDPNLDNHESSIDERGTFADYIGGMVHLSKEVTLFASSTVGSEFGRKWKSATPYD